MKRSLIAFVAAAILVIAIVRQSEAADPRDEEAKAIFVVGVGRFDQGDMRGALEAFERAYALAPYPIVLYDIGLACAALGDPVRAVDAMERVLAAPGNLRKERLTAARRVLTEQRRNIGALALRSPIKGARARVDERDVGVLPLQDYRVRAGEIFIEVEAQGFKPLRKPVTIAPGTTTEVDIALEPAGALGHLKVVSSLSRADILVDGLAVGKTPMRSTIAVDVGSHRVEVRREGYRTASESVTIAEGGSAELTLEPKEDASDLRLHGGRLKLAVSPADASVFVDGARRELPTEGLLLAAGLHVLRFERRGHDTIELELDIPRRGRTERAVVLTPTPEERELSASTARARRTGGGIAIGVGGSVSVAAVALLGWNVANKADIDRRTGEREDATGEFEGCGHGELLQPGPCSDRNLALARDTDAATAIDVASSIGLVLGAVGAVTGAVIVATTKGAPAAPKVEDWAILPAVVPVRGGLFVGAAGHF